MPTVAEQQRCPDCNEALRADAKKCACGWSPGKRPSGKAEVPRVACGYPKCTTPAICKVRIGKRNWLHACDSHYVWAGERNLDYLLASQRQREPGDDDEEVAA